MSPRMEAFKAWAQKNRVVLGAGAAALVVGVAVMRSRKGGSGSSSSTSTTTGGPSANGQLAGVNGAAYDSTSSDVYNALQPQIEATQEMLRQLKEGTKSPLPTPDLGSDDPVMKPQPTTELAAPTLDKISTNYWSSTGSIYNGQLSDGTSVPIKQNDVWSNAFGGNSWGTAAGGYGAAQADQIREQLASKGLLTPRGGYSGGGYTEESMGAMTDASSGRKGW